MKITLIEDTYTQAPIKQHKRTLRFLPSVICLFFIVFLLQQKAIGQNLSINTSGALPDSSAMLDIISANKGLLIPRVSLTSTTDTVTITNPATSLLVYNTNATMTGGSGLGYYYYNGSVWMNFLSGTGNSLTTPLIIGGSGTTSSLTYKPTTGAGTTGADHIFKVGNNGGTEAMRILNSGILQMANNKYISLPNYTQLDFKNSSGTQGYGQIFVDNATGTYAGANGLAFFLNGATRLAILSGGNVGIGTTAPISSKLQLVATGSGFTQEKTSGGYFYSTGFNGNDPYLTYYAGSGMTLGYGTTTGAAPTISTLRLLTNGNVGIGIAAPLQKLHIETTTTANAIAASNLSTTGDSYGGVFRATGVGATNNFGMYAQASGGSTNYNIYSGTLAAGANNYSIYSTALAKSYFGGDLGVGTTTPNILGVGGGAVTLTIAAPAGNIYPHLELVGNRSVGGNQVGTINWVQGTTEVARMYIGNGVSALDESFMSFYTKTTGVAIGERMRIDKSGNIGIGLTSPSAKLHVLSSTEQSRLGYDASNYYSTTVGSTGGVTFDAVGAGSAFTFSDAVNLPTASAGVTQSLNDSTTKLATTAFVDRALSGVSGGSGWGLTGTSGTTDVTNFIGTTDNIPFSIKVNNQKSGRIDQTLKNAFWGYQAGTSNTTGHDNVAIGHQALNSNTTGYENTANGVKALYSNTGGINNTATGFQALYKNITGINNTANGWWALLNNTTGDANTANGLATLYFNTTGYYNSASGYEALFWNTTGYKNTANGYFSLFSNTSGYHNTGHGHGTGYTNTTGYNNTFVGYNADISSAALNNATAIGANTSVNATNKVRIGDANVTVIEGQVAFTNVSDGRFKKNISESDVKGLPFIMRLRPVVYNLDTRQFEEFLTKNKPDSIRVKHFKNKDFTASTAVRHSGFIAQEVELAAQETNYDFNGIHKPEGPDDNYGLAYSEFVVPLVKAMQEQQQQLNAKDSVLTSLQNQLNSKDILLTSLQTQIDQLTILIQQSKTPK